MPFDEAFSTPLHKPQVQGQMQENGRNYYHQLYYSLTDISTGFIITKHPRKLIKMLTLQVINTMFITYSKHIYSVV